MSYPVLCGAVVLTSTNNVIRFSEGAFPIGDATITPGTYYLRGDGTASDLCLAVKNAFEALNAGSANVYSVTVARSIDPAVAHTLVTITRTSGTDAFGAIWTSGNTTFDQELLGFTVSDTISANPKTSTQAAAACWGSNDVAREIEPVSERIVAVPRAASGRVQGVTRSARMQSWRLGLSFVDERRMLVENALSGTQDTLEGFMERFGAGASMELHEQPTLLSATTLAGLTGSTLVDVVHFSEDSLSRFEPTRIGPGVPLYSIDLRLHAKV